MKGPPASTLPPPGGTQSHPTTTRGGMEPADDGLIVRVRGGDREAFSLLVRRYHGTLVRLAAGYVANRQTAEEVAQEAWLGVLEGLERFQGRSSFRTWLFTIVVNRAKTRGVREGRSLPFSALGEGDGDEEPAVPPSRFNAQGRWSEPPSDWKTSTPESLLEQAETHSALIAAIAALPENYRIVITLRDVEGLDSNEVCRILEISEANQRVLLHRARARIRQALESIWASK